MRQLISTVTVVVPDYDAAIAFYVATLGFTLVEDTRLTEEKRWVLVAPPGSAETRLLLAKAATPEQRAAIGNQTGGRVFLFLSTDDFARDHEAMRRAGVRFLEEPREEPYGMVAVFADPFGNRWDLIGPRHA
jgi:catechol 2,3-dioxygenase-like lactoylglutathione lyase family enzyme